LTGKIIGRQILAHTPQLTLYQSPLIKPSSSDREDAFIAEMKKALCDHVNIAPKKCVSQFPP